MEDKLSYRQAQNEVKFNFQVKFDLEGHGRSSPKTIGILTQLFSTSVINLVIVAWTADELLCGQACNWYTHRDTQIDTQTQVMAIPEGQNWPWVKIDQINWNGICVTLV